MAGRRAARGTLTREQWAAAIRASAADSPDRAGGRRARRGRTVLSRARIVAAALEVVRDVGYDRLTMRAVADALDTGPASLYQHVPGKAQLGDLLVAELCSRVDLPVPDAAHWRDQFVDVCSRLRDQFLRYPGVSHAALASVPADLAPLGVAEALFTLLLLAGASPRDAAWTGDAAFLHVVAHCLETSVAETQRDAVPGEVIDRDEIAERLRMLPADGFRNTVRYAGELTAGTDDDRFDFALQLILDGLVRRTNATGPGPVGGG